MWKPRSAGQLCWLSLLLAGCAVKPSADANPPVEPAQPGVATPAASDWWFGAYLQDHKIGYMNVQVEPITKDGRQLLKYTANDHVVLDILGQRMEQTTTSTTLCDLQYHPLEAEFSMVSGGSTTSVTAHFFADRIEARKTTADSSVDQVIEIPVGQELVVDERAVASEGQLKVGETIAMYQFNPVSLSIDQHELTGLSTEPLTLDGETIETTRVQLKAPYATAQVWVSGDGEMQQLKLPLGQTELLFKREKPEVAALMPDESGPRVDLVVSTSIRPSTPLENPRGVTRLKLKVEGLDALKTVPSDDWQTVTPLDGGGSEVVIAAKDADQETSDARLPAADEQKFLSSTTYIETDHPDIQAAAKDALGEDPPSEPVARAWKIHDYVHRLVKWQSNIGLPRSALEILHNPAGVCRDNAALYTALARAAGLPTRICAGVVYVNGAFMGHAWAETWIGRWQPFDATLAQHKVDATHLKLAEGEKYTCLFEMLPALGKLKIEVLEVDHGTGIGG